MHVVLAQDLPDRVDARLNRGLVVRGAVLPEQVLQHVSGNDRVTLDRLHQVLADDQAREVLVDLVVKLTHGASLISFFRSRTRW